MRRLNAVLTLPLVLALAGSLATDARGADSESDLVTIAAAPLRTPGQFGLGQEVLREADVVAHSLPAGVCRSTSFVLDRVSKVAAASGFRQEFDDASKQTVSGNRPGCMNYERSLSISKFRETYPDSPISGNEGDVLDIFRFCVQPVRQMDLCRYDAVLYATRVFRRDSSTLRITNFSRDAYLVEVKELVTKGVKQ